MMTIYEHCQDQEDFADLNTEVGRIAANFWNARKLRLTEDEAAQDVSTVPVSFLFEAPDA